MNKLSDGSIYGAFLAKVKEHPDKMALAFLGNEWSFRELNELSERFAAALMRLGIATGDRVLLYLPNIPQAMIAFLGLQRLGAIPVAISSIYTTSELRYMTNDSGARIILCMDTNFGYVAQALPETKVRHVIVCTMAELLPPWKRLVLKAFKRVPEGAFSLGNNVYSFKQLMRESAIDLPPVPDGTKEETATLLYTGGTTGEPKGVPISNLQFLENALQAREVSVPMAPMGESVQLQAAPLYHILGQGSGIGAALCAAGDTLIMTPRVNLDAHFDHIQRYHVSVMYGVPTYYRMILEHDRLDQYDLSSLRFCMVGGDTVPLELIERWKSNFGRPLYQGYGITECGTISLCSPVDECPAGSIGKPLPMNEILIVDPDTLEPVPTGTSGELLMHSTHMVRAYWNKPEETSVSFADIGGKLWYRSKDLMRQDKGGWLYFVDRSADIIKHKGYRVAASEIEQVLNEHPVVTAASVVGVPDPKIGERIKAFVVLRDDIRGIGSYELLSWCRQRLASYKVPQYIEFRDMLPKSKVGKVLRRELRDEERKKQEK